jgi:transcription elongation factor GreA
MFVTQAEYDQITEELEVLRSTHRQTLTDRLRHARAFGVMGDQDDQLAAFEDAAVGEGRITRLERLVASARVVDGVTEGAAGLGAIVRVKDSSGREAQYELVGVRNDDATRPQVTPGSPMGQALFGASAGDNVRVSLPDGRERELTVLAVSYA